MMRSLAKDSVIEKILDEAEAAQQCAIFSGRVSSQKVQRRVAAKYLTSPARGLFARSARWKSLKPDAQCLYITRALSVSHPNWIFSYSTAALLLGLEVPYAISSPVHAAYTVANHTPHSAIVRRHFMDEGLKAEVALAGGIRATSPIRTVFDCARFYPLEQSLGIIDSGMRKYGLSQAQLLGFCDVHSKFRGCAEAKRAVAHGNGLSENGGESFARARMIGMGFVEPRLQREFVDHITGQRYRSDYSWLREDGSTLIGEFHGRQKYLDPAMTGGRDIETIISAETKRRNRISVNNTEVMDFDYGDVSDWSYFYSLLTDYGVPRCHDSTAHVTLMMPS